MKLIYQRQWWQMNASVKENFPEVRYDPSLPVPQHQGRHCGSSAAARESNTIQGK